jgi:hypothetical protein
VFRFLRRMAGGSPQKDWRTVDGLLPGPEFALALAKERARVDRGGPGFCMLALAIDLAPENVDYQNAVCILSALLQERTRLIDTKGWFGERVAVIFPQTPAGRVAHIWPPIKEALDQQLDSGGPEPFQLPEVRCEVYAYPCEGESSALDGNE